MAAVFYKSSCEYSDSWKTVDGNTNVNLALWMLHGSFMTKGQLWKCFLQVPELSKDSMEKDKFMIFIVNKARRKMTNSQKLII